MNQIPNDMHYCSVHFLNPMDAVRRYDETVVRYFRKATTVLARESYRQYLFFAGCLQRINQVGRFTARTEPALPYRCPQGVPPYSGPKR
jgi:hypothetical protein